MTKHKLNQPIKWNVKACRHEVEWHPTGITYPLLRPSIRPSVRPSVHPPGRPAACPSARAVHAVRACRCVPVRAISVHVAQRGVACSAQTRLRHAARRHRCQLFFCIDVIFVSTDINCLLQGPTAASAGWLSSRRKHGPTVCCRRGCQCEGVAPKGFREWLSVGWDRVCIHRLANGIWAV